MNHRFLIVFFAGLAVAAAAGRTVFSTPPPAGQEAEDATIQEDGDHLRAETPYGPVHLWRPSNYDPHTAGTVVYIHGYFTSADRTWSDDHLAAQFRDSGRNALFITIEAPQSNGEDVAWKSLDNLLKTVEDLSPSPLPPGPVVVVGHSGAYRTMLLWLRDPRLQELILLDALYAGQGEFRSWLRPSSRATPHRMVLVSIDTWRQSSRFARRVPGTARRRSIPTKSTSFTARETRARLLYLRSQYEHNEIVSGGKVIPVLLQISPLKSFAAEKPRPARASPHKPPALSTQD
jgi:hypothetical protein